MMKEIYEASKIFQIPEPHMLMRKGARTECVVLDTWDQPKGWSVADAEVNKRFQAILLQNPVTHQTIHALLASLWERVKADIKREYMEEIENAIRQEFKGTVTVDFRSYDK